MINIWSIDDEAASSARLKELLAVFFNENGRSYTFQSFTDPAQAMASEEIPDLVFMDIEIGQVSGLDLARELKKRNRHMEIALLSSFPSYSIEGYSSGASRFLVKPLDLAQLRKAFDPDFLKALDRQTVVHDPRIFSRPIPIRSIVYIETIDRNTEAVLENGQKLVTRLTLKEWRDLLRDAPFVQCYKSILVNLDHVRDLDSADKNVLLDGGGSIPYSRHFKKELQTEWQAHRFSTL